MAAIIGNDPYLLFSDWFNEAVKKQGDTYNAAALATATTTCIPSVRVILIKSFNESGFVFYTSLLSNKSKDLMANPRCSLCFYWAQIHKQVRIDGNAELLTDSEADEYFATRERESQLEAWASQQSEVLPSTDVIQEKYLKYRKQFDNQLVTRPPFWSGFRILPNTFEFWLAGPHRRHTRLFFEKQDKAWKKTYLYP